METRNTFRKLSILLVAMIVCGTFGMVAQSNDTLRIKKVIDNYVVGWRHSDKELLSEVFDVDAGVVLWVDRKENPERLKSMTLYDLLHRSKPQDDFGFGYAIESLQIVDSKLAIALVNIPIGESHYIDCLELQKIRGKWKIILKSFVYFPKSHQKD